MGQDKALLRGGRLSSTALDKLRASLRPHRASPARSDLSCYAPVVPDLHPGCGPLSGIEAALAPPPSP